MNRKAWISVPVVVIAAAVAIAAMYQFRRSETESKKNAVPAVKLVIATFWTSAGGNVMLAERMGFFRDQGLEVTLQPYPNGSLALAALIEGKADLATVGGPPIALGALKGRRFLILATLFESATVINMIARRDRGIDKPSDLAGKKLGTVFGSVSEFLQDSILDRYDVDSQSIVRINLAPAQTVSALLAGEVDAVTIWAPYALDLRNRLGNQAVVFGTEASYTSPIVLLGRKDLVTQHPEVMRRVLAALDRANAFARSDSSRSVREIAQTLGLDEAIVTADWDPLKFTLGLNQSLVIFLEEQARWAIRRRLVDADAVPNFLEWIYADALAAVKPEAVSVIR